MDKLTGSSTLYLGVTILLLASSTLAADDKPSLWHVSIWNSPAPPPDQGPPFSKNASRNMSLLPAQACCIVGAYLFTVLTLGMALLFVGRRLRRAAEASGSTLGVEMVKRTVALPYEASPMTPSKPGFEASPVSIETRTTATWPSPDKASVGDNFSWPNGHRQQSSVVTFDKSVIDKDKAQRELELERLYAAVMDYDDQRSLNVTPSPGGASGYKGPTSSTTPRPAPPPPTPPKITIPKPPSRKHSKSDSRASRLSRQSSMASTSSKRKGSSVRGLTISSPISAVSSSDGYSPYISGDDSDLVPLRPPSSPPIPHLHRLQHIPASSSTSPPLAVSQPTPPTRSIRSPFEQDSAGSGSRQPPYGAAQSQQQKMKSSQRRTPSNSSLTNTNITSSPYTRGQGQQQNYYQNPVQNYYTSEVQPQAQSQSQSQSRSQLPPALQVPPRTHTLVQHAAAPQSQSHPSHTSYPQSQAPAPPQPILRLPPRAASRDKVPMASNSASSPPPPASNDHRLPSQPQLSQSPQRLHPTFALSSPPTQSTPTSSSHPATTKVPLPSSGSASASASASATNPTLHLPLRSTASTDTWTTKTTVIESSRPAPGSVPRPLGTGNRTGFAAGGLLSPYGGGVPATPYSPYMPFTPLTPVTPRLVTRAERKQRQKDGGRKVAFAEDQVRDDRDVW